MQKRTETPIEKLARFIVDKRKAFYLVFMAAVVFAAAAIPRVKVNDDITAYLPPETETRRGLSLMEEEFTTYGSAQVMISNVTFDKAQEIADQLAKIEGVSGVEFDDTPSHYQDASALFSVSFSAENDDPAAKETLQAVQDLVASYDNYVVNDGDAYDSASLMKEMSIILVIAAAVIVAVLLFTSKSYMEVVVFLIVFVVSAILNMGTNFIFDSISFITNSIAVVLQLALAIDYAIIFCHRYMEEREFLDAREADIAALSKAIVEISSSSLTTISGLVALMLMQFRIGFDMGIVLSKGILCSMATVFLLMPGLLMLFNRSIEKTRHRNFVPRISSWGKIIMKLRFVLPIIFVVIVLFSIFGSHRCDYVFSTNSTNSGNKPAYRIALDKINDTFGYHNTIAVLVPKGNYPSEHAILRRAEQLDGITSATGLANIEVEDGRWLTDKINPRQFAELAGVDVELARLLFQAYGFSVEEYGAIFQDPDNYSAPLLDVFQFLCEQKDRGVVNLTGDQAKQVDDLQETLDSGLKQLQGTDWTRLVFTADLPDEGPETRALLDELRSIASDYYGDQVILVGNSTNARDLSDSFSGDTMKISILTVLFVMVILLFTFQSAGLPVLLVLTIQGSIWINFSFPYLTGTNLFFMSYLIVSAIQMGATIDYAIVITNRYLDLKRNLSPKEAAVEALNQAFPTILTSGSIMTVAGFLIGKLSTDTIISSIGATLGRGTLTSIILVMTVLPQLLVLGDLIIQRTALTLNRNRKQRFQNGVMRLDGHVRGHVSGFVDGEFKGVMRGSIDALIESKKQELTLEDQEDTQ